MRGVVWNSWAEERSLGRRSRARRNVETTLTVMDDLGSLAWRALVMIDDGEARRALVILS